MANKPTQPVFPLGLAAEEQSTLAGVLNTGTIEHGPDAVLTLPEGNASAGLPSSVRYNADSDEFEGFYENGGWLPLGGGGIRWEVLPHASTTTLTEGRGYLINNTTGASTVVLPSPTRIGDSVTICDAYGKFATYPLTVSPSGNNLYGSTEDMAITTDNVSATFTWSGPEQGWIITSGVGLGQGRVYSREIFTKILASETSSVALNTPPTIVDVYADGKRLAESKYSLDGNVITFSPSLPANTELQVIEYTPIQLGNGGGSSSSTITWVYNGGSAIGGETEITLDVVVDDVPAIDINGSRQYKNLGFTFDPLTSKISLAQELEPEDEVVVIINGTPNIYNQIDYTLREVARVTNVKDTEVVYFSVGAALSGYKVIYDKETQRAYPLPADIAPGTTAVSLSTAAVLVHSAGSVDLGELAVSREEYVTLSGTFDSGAVINTKNELLTHTDGKYRWDGALPKEVPADSTPTTTGGVGDGAWVSVGVASLRSDLLKDDGYTLVPSVQIQQWRNEGDIRGWGAVDGGFNDSAILAALNSDSPSVKLGGRGFVSKLRDTITHKSNKVMHSGSLNFQFDGGTQQEKSGILMANISNAKVIDVDITGTLDGGIRGYGGSNIVIDGVNVHDIGISTLSGECGLGIWFGDYANYDVQTDGLLIQNCRVNNIGGVGMQRGDGILVYNAKNFKVRHNTIVTTNRMGIAAGSDTRQFEIHGNYIGDTLLAGIDIEPDSGYTASNGKVYNNTIVGFASRYFTEGAGVGQTFGVDIHAITSYIKVYGNTLSAGQYGTEAFHIGNHADEIEITDNDLIGGAVVIPLFIKTYDGSGSKHIKINCNRAKGTCKSFADVYMSEDVYISENVFSGDSSNDSYFLRASTIAGLNVDYNRSSNTTNFIKSGDAGNTSNVKVTNNNISTLSDGIDMLTSGSMTGFIATGNTILCPASNKGISLEIAGSGSISDISLRGNIIYNATTKIYVSPAATGWDMLTKNTRFDLSGVQNGTQLFELSRNRVTQFLNGIWDDS